MLHRMGTSPRSGMILTCSHCVGPWRLDDIVSHIYTPPQGIPFRFPQCHSASQLFFLDPYIQGIHAHHLGLFLMFNDPKGVSSPVVQVRLSSFCRTTGFASIPGSLHCVCLSRNLRRTTLPHLAQLRKNGRRVVVLLSVGQGVCPATRVAPCLVSLSVSRSRCQDAL